MGWKSVPGAGGGGAASIAGVAGLTGFGEDNLAATLTDSLLYRNVQGVESQIPVVMSDGGSIVGISVASSEARSAGTATFEVFKNGVGTGLTTVLDGTDTQYASASQVPNTDTFVTDDRLDIRVTTDGSWAPTTADVEATIFVLPTGAVIVPQWVGYLAGRQSDETADAGDDFYDDGAAGGTEVTISGAQTVTEKYGRLSVLITSSMAANDVNCQLIARSMSVGDIIETACVAMVDDDSDGFLFFGPILTDGTTSAAEAAWCAARLRDTQLGQVELEGRGGTLTDMSAAAGAVDEFKWVGGLIYLRLEYDAANTWRTFISPDGVSWIDTGTFSHTFTPDHFGVGWSTWSDTLVTDRIVAFEYVRPGT